MQNFTDPAILFFVLGLFAGAVRSDLQIPEAVGKFLSLYLLMALGLKGGSSLAESGVNFGIALTLGAAVVMAFIVPLMGYSFLKRFVGSYDAVAVSGAYGSVSAVTFVTAAQFLVNKGFSPGGHMALAMVLMESPAIIVSVLLAHSIRHSLLEHSKKKTLEKNNSSGIGKILHESFTNGSHLMLLGSLVIGLVSGGTGQSLMQPFFESLFKGMLAFFLLDMGLMVAKNFKGALKTSPVLLAYALFSPFLHAFMALGLSLCLHVPMADGALLMVLSASASYIVVPAVLRYAIPEANPAVYFGLSLGVTFPLNMIVGIPFYTSLAEAYLNP